MNKTKRGKKLKRLLGLCVRRTFWKKSSQYIKLSCVSYMGRGYSEVEDAKIYWEAPLAFTIWSDKGPLFALAVEFWNDTLCIRQLQGVGGASIPEDLRHWPNMFVEACCLFARKANFKRVRLYRANQSLFYAYPDVSKVPLEKQIEEVSAIRKRMTRRYDYTAEQAGFVMMPRWGEWTNLKVRH